MLSGRKSSKEGEVLSNYFDTLDESDITSSAWHSVKSAVNSLDTCQRCHFYYFFAAESLRKILAIDDGKNDSDNGFYFSRATHRGVMLVLLTES